MMSTNKTRKSSSCPFAGAKTAPKRKKSSKRLNKDRAKDLAASDEGSYFEQEQSLPTKEKDESQDDDEMVSASRAKILQRTTEESQGTERQESWQKWLAEQLCPGIVCKKLKPACKISYLSFLSFRCDFARECFCDIRTWIVVYRELQKRQKQHLTRLVNYKCSIVWRKMSLSFINHLMIIFTRLVYLILFDRKNAPKLIFYRISTLKFYWVGRTYLVRFGRSLNLFCWNLARMLPDNRAQKRCRENFNFCVFQKLWPFLWRELLFYLSPKFKAVSRKN